MARRTFSTARTFISSLMRRPAYNKQYYRRITTKETLSLTRAGNEIDSESTNCRQPQITTSSGTVSHSDSSKPDYRLPHLNSSSEVHMVSVSSKTPSLRTATAIGYVAFSNNVPLSLIRANAMVKGDVLAVARVAGVMSVKKTSDIVPLCHSGLAVEGVDVKVEAVDADTTTESSQDQERSRFKGDDFETHLRQYLYSKIAQHGGVRIAVTVHCHGKTGVEMEALTGVMGAALTIIDMCKAVDKMASISGVQIARKEGGKSGSWLAKEFEP
jgi:GTP 3',8-cyclase